MANSKNNNVAMRAIKEKPRPSLLEKTNYIRHCLENLKQDTLESELKELRAKWGKAVVDSILADLKEEQRKGSGGPKRYYVSLREPLEGFER